MTLRVWGWRLLFLSVLLLFYLRFDFSHSDAHALLVRSIPEAAAELTAPPATIDLWFSEPLERRFSNAHLVDPIGTEIAVGNSTVDLADPAHMTLTLSPLLSPLAPGIYTVVWRTLSSADGHEWVGSFPLTVLNADGTRPAVASTEPSMASQSTLPTPVEIVVRWLSLMGALLLLGGAASRLWAIEPATTSGEIQELLLRGSEWALLTGIVALICGGWQQMVVQADKLGDAGMVGALLLQTRMGNLIVVRQTVVLIMLVGGLLLRYGQGRTRALVGPRTELGVTILLSLVVLSTFSLASHAAAVGGSGWALLVDYVHLIAAALWLGGLWLLTLCLWNRRHIENPVSGDATSGDALRHLVRRFSAVATLSVFVLLATGLFSSFVQLHTIDQLWLTTYGQLLLIKVALVFVALLLALRNHRWVRNAEASTANAHPQQSRYRALLRQLGGESAVGLVLMLVVAMLVQTPPQLAPAAVPAADNHFMAILTADDLTIHLQVAPNQVGNNQYVTHLYHADGSAIGEVQLVRLQFTHQTAELGQATLDLAAQGADSFRGEGAYLNRAGAWNVAVYVRRRGMDDLLAQTVVEVPSPLSTSPAAVQSLWQNPLPQLPLLFVIGGTVVAALCFLLLWRYVVSFKPK